MLLLYGILALATVSSGVLSFSLRPENYDASNPALHRSQRRVFERRRDGELRQRYRELNPASQREYIRARRRIQSVPQFLIRNQDHLDIESPIFNAPLPVVTRQNRQAGQRRQDNIGSLKLANTIIQTPIFRGDGIRQLPIRTLMEDDKQTQRYVQHFKPEEAQLLRQIKPTMHRRERQPGHHRLSGGPFVNPQSEDAPPQIIYRIPEEKREENNVRVIQQVSPIKLSYESSSDGEQPTHANHKYMGEEFTPSALPQYSSHKIEDYPVSKERNPEHTERRVQLSEPEIEEFQQKQQEELLHYRRQKEQKERRQQLENKQRGSLEYPSGPEVGEQTRSSQLVAAKRPERPYKRQYREPIELKPVYSSTEVPHSREYGLPQSWEEYDSSPEYIERSRGKQSVRHHPNAFRNSFEKDDSDIPKEKRQVSHEHHGFDKNGQEFAAAASAAELAHGHGGDGRLTFQLHGQNGPHSYRFGFDTGKGPNRQFRYEERDNDGLVKGRYGYYDPHGKLQMYNYSAHPHHGYSAAEAH